MARFKKKKWGSEKPKVNKDTENNEKPPSESDLPSIESEPESEPKVSPKEPPKETEESAEDKSATKKLSSDDL